MSRPVLANLGFVFQIAGMLMVIPIGLGFYLNELEPLIAFFTTAVAFFGGGFLLNAFSQREDMDFKSSSVLITSAFFLLGLIGSIPYLYMDVFPGEPLAKFTNSYFESMSGYTTGGFSLIKNVDELPDSMIFYRSLTQWIGGIGIIFILLAFFYNREITLEGISRAIGLERVTRGIKLILSHILTVYLVYTAVFVAILYYLGFTDILKDFSLIFSALATGGFSPTIDLPGMVATPAFFVIMLVMLLGAINFFLHDKIMLGRVRGLFKTEFLVFIIVLIVGIILFSWASDLPMRDAVFHAVSASTTGGFGYLDFSTLTDAAKMILIALMFVGGMTFSTAGGIKVLRLIMFFKTIPWILDKVMYNSRRPLTFEGQNVDEKSTVVYLIFPVLAAFIIFVSAFVFTVYGYGMAESLFESVAAYSLTGFSTGIVQLGMPLELEWWLVVLMVIGRVELIAFLIFLKPRNRNKEKEQSS